VLFHWQPTTELRGFAPIGMMEPWNCGMMGLKKTEFKAHIQSSNIPLFRHSMWLEKENGHKKKYNSNKL
jgi:hypothetical protein